MIIDFILFEKENIVQKAKKFSKESHAGTYRKGLNNKKIEYFVHPNSVAEIVKRVKKSHKIKELISAAYLHDVVENVENVTIKDIKKEFGDLVSNLVNELTNDEEQLKIQGKENYLKNKLLTISSWGLIIKLADRLDNVSDIKDIMKYGDEKRKKWAKNYAAQTKAIITTLEKNRNLSETQKKLVDEIKEKIKDYVK